MKSLDIETYQEYYSIITTCSTLCL
jgi:hypothetical protein